MKTLDARSIFAPLRGGRWLKLTALLALPIGSYLVARERASWQVDAPRSNLPESKTPTIASYGVLRGYAPKGSSSEVNKIVFSPDGTMLAAVNFFSFGRFDSSKGASYRWGNQIIVWNVALRKLLHGTILNSQQVESFCFSPNGASLAALCTKFSGPHPYPKRLTHIGVWDTRTGKRLHKISPRGNGFKPSPRRTFWDHVSWSNNAVLTDASEIDTKHWSARTGKLLRTLPPSSEDPYDPYETVLSPNGRLRANVGDDSASAVLRDARTGRRLHTLKAISITDRLTFSSDSKALLVCSDKGHLQAWNTMTGQLKWQTWFGTNTMSFDIAFSPDTSLVAAGGSGITLFNSQTGKVLRALPDEIGTTLAFSPNGASLASGGSDGTVKLWRIK